jgi:hypothetical protein
MVVVVPAGFESLMYLDIQLAGSAFPVTAGPTSYVLLLVLVE